VAELKNNHMIKIIVTTKDELENLIQESVRKVIPEKSNVDHSGENGKPFSLKEAASFLNLAPQTLYGFTSKNLIPFIKRGKKLYFQKAELEKWLLEGKRNVSSNK